VLAGLVIALGVLRPADAVAPSPKMQVAGHAGQLIVLTPPAGAAPTGEVTLVQPLIGMVAYAKVSGTKAQLPYFLYDARDGEDGVLVLAGHLEPRLVTPSKTDIKEIDAALLRDEVLSGVKRAIAGTEIGAIDIDGDGTADYAVTYGCNAWADGACQSHGQFFLARAGTRWVEIE
jgi:hypothetical protein